LNVNLGPGFRRDDVPCLGSPPRTSAYLRDPRRFGRGWPARRARSRRPPGWRV